MAVQPEVVSAIENLRREGVLSDARAAALLPAARRELVSLRAELNTLLYAGVLLAVSGIGLFLKVNHDRIGPTAIASLLAAASAGCILFVFRRSPPFSWGAAASTHVAADYVLLLGVLLAGSDLAYLETQFRFLGPDWPYHLLVLSVIAFAAAYRFDSRVALSLALSSFAAWRGLSTRFPFEPVLAGRWSDGRINALLCGGLFLAAAVFSARAKRKAHFEGVFAGFGWLFLFGGLLSGAFDPGGNWPLWAAAAFFAAVAVVVFAYRTRRPFDFAVAVVAAYLSLLRPLWLGVGKSEEAFFFLVAASSLSVLVFLVFSYRRMRTAA
jgi:hypothetical protein